MIINWIKQSDNKLLLFVLLLFFIKLISFFTVGENFLRFTEPWVLLSILFLFIYKYRKISIVLKGFILFALLGDVSGLFAMQIKGIELETIAYCLGYLCLIYEAIYKIKKFKISFIIALYLIFVFSVNIYFIYELYDIFREVIVNNLELSLIVVRLVSLLLFALFSFTVYLSSETKQSILLLLMSISLIFSDILYLINEYYLYLWVFELLSKTLYIATFYCFYLYVSGYYRSNSNPRFKELMP
ncbi:MAG: hypothetical protein HKO81_03850 [Flavobacteriaceae bacterium]|nr:hypothetical protein [Flavobacteriaceae bacterium]